MESDWVSVMLIIWIADVSLKIGQNQIKHCYLITVIYELGGVWHGNCFNCIACLVHPSQRDFCIVIFFNDVKIVNLFVSCSVQILMESYEGPACLGFVSQMN